MFFRTVYMAEWGKKTLHAFRREPSNELTHLWVLLIFSMAYAAFLFVANTSAKVFVLMNVM